MFLKQIIQMNSYKLSIAFFSSTLYQLTKSSVYSLTENENFNIEGEQITKLIALFSSTPFLWHFLLKHVIEVTKYLPHILLKTPAGWQKVVADTSANRSKTDWWLICGAAGSKHAKIRPQ